MKLFLPSRSASTLLTLAALAACSSSPSGTSGTSGASGTSGTSGVPVSTADCQSRCEAKFTSCGGNATSSKNNCASQVCNASPTSDQLTCLENKACNDISAAPSFASLCGAATTPDPTPTGASCGSATCGAGEYCSLSYDSQQNAWNPSGCRKVPAACTSSGAAALCTCMQKNTGCPTSGLVSTKCGQSNGALSFGCN